LGGAEAAGVKPRERSGYFKTFLQSRKNGFIKTYSSDEPLMKSTAG
jgi:hypothetical protein